jgi:hypothetical protein
VTASECEFCKKYRNRYQITVGDFCIIKRRVLTSSPKKNDSHLHICIAEWNRDAVIYMVAFVIGIVGVLIFLKLIKYLAHGKSTGLVVGLAAAAIVITVLVGTIGNLLVTTVGNFPGIVRPSYGELLLLLSQASVPTEYYSLRRQYLLDSALKLYAANMCKRHSYQELLKWINHNERTPYDYYNLAIGLNKLLYTKINWPLMRQM